MEEKETYFGGLFHAIGSLATGLKTSMREFFTPSETITTDDGKKKRILARYEYNLGSCMFCQLCVNACPHHAITFDQQFEHAVFDRSKLVMTLNHPGSHVEEKAKPTTE